MNKPTLKSHTNFFNNILKNLVLKKYLLISGIILVIIIVTLFLIPYICNINNSKPYIINKFKQATGRQLKLDGRISLKLLPNVHFQVDGVSITNPSQLGHGNFITIQSLDATIALTPLFHGTVKINHLFANGVTVAMLTNESTNNWSFKPPSTNKQNSSLTLALNAVELTDFTFKYQNLNTGELYTTESINLGLKTPYNGTIKLAKDEILFKNAILNVDDKFISNINFKLESTNTITYTGDLKTNEFSLPQLMDIFNLAWPKNLKKSPFSHLTLSIAVEGTQKLAKFKNINLTNNKSTLVGAIEVITTPLSVKQNLSLNKAELSDYINFGKLKLVIESLTMAGNLGTTSTKFKLAELNGKEQIKIQRLTMYGFDIKKFTFQVNKAIKDISFISKLTAALAAKATVKPIDEAIKNVWHSSPVDMKDKSNLGSLNATLEFKDGKVATPVATLSGPSLKSSGNGIANLNNKTLNYAIVVRLISPANQTVINHINFPFILRGPFSNIKGELNTSAVIKQLVNYYSTNKKDKAFFNKIFGSIQQKQCIILPGGSTWLAYNY